MQRDFGLIDEMFGIVIRNDKSRGYYIAELDEMTDNYKELLLNFELLSSINTDSVLQKYVLAEHRRNAIIREWEALCMLELMPKHISGKAAIELINPSQQVE